MSQEVRESVTLWCSESRAARLTGVLNELGIATSSWYRRAVPPEARKRPGPAAKSIDPQVVQWVLAMATNNPWYGYKRIEGMCRPAKPPGQSREAQCILKDTC